MIDSDLARLYGVQTYNLNKAIKRNSERFPDDFMFQLTDGEYKNLIFQIGISSSLWGGRRYLPYAFTQEGIAMLSSVLRSKSAVRVNIAIMRAFVKIRHALAVQQDLTRRIEKAEGRLQMHETDIRLIRGDISEVKKNLEKPKEPVRVRGFSEK